MNEMNLGLQVLRTTSKLGGIVRSPNLAEKAQKPHKVHVVYRCQRSGCTSPPRIIAYWSYQVPQKIDFCSKECRRLTRANKKHARHNAVVGGVCHKPTEVTSAGPAGDPQASGEVQRLPGGNGLSD